MISDTVNLSSDDSNDALSPSAVSQVAQQDKNAAQTMASDEVSSGTSGGCLTHSRPMKRSDNGESDENPTAAESKAKKQKMADLMMICHIHEIYTPAECMKYMTVEGHPSLWSSWWWSDVQREVTAAGAKVVQSSLLCHPGVVLWSRTLPRSIDIESGAVTLSPRAQACARALYVKSVEEIAEQVNDESLAAHIAEIRTLVDCDLTFVLCGYKDYFNGPRRKTMNSNRTPMTEINLELALTDILVSNECDTKIVNTPNELARFIAMITKAIAEGPNKKWRQKFHEETHHYIQGDNKRSIAMDKNGVAVGRLWQQMIAILPNSSLEISRALCANYKSPLALFEECQSTDCVNKIADIGVSRAAVPGSKARRIGKEFANKLRILFTADDGNILVK